MPQDNKRRTILCCLLLTATGATPAWGHSAPPPADPTLDAMSNRVATAGIVALLGMASFFWMRALVSAYESRKRVAFNERHVLGGTGTVTASLMGLLWYLSAPMPARQATGHVDMPRHGGQIRAVGSSHVETVLGDSGSVTLYLMGITEAVAAPVKEHELWAQAQAGAQTASVLLHAVPQTGDPKGQASMFTGLLPADLQGKPLALSVSLPLEGPQQTVQFAFNGTTPTAASLPAHDTSAVRVAAVPLSAEQKALYLTPGGLYTQADVAANGSTTPDIKFAGLMANHHLNPKKGTYTCPITKTQANTKFVWTVGGKRYLFCCPPCIAEFVKQAKTHPASIHPPQDYIQP